MQTLVVGVVAFFLYFMIVCLPFCKVGASITADLDGTSATCNPLTTQRGSHYMHKTFLQQPKLSCRLSKKLSA